jgi:hypothetical protein
MRPWNDSANKFIFSEGTSIWRLLIVMNVINQLAIQHLNALIAVIQLLYGLSILKTKRLDMQKKQLERLNELRTVGLKLGYGKVKDCVLYVDQQP